MKKAIIILVALIAVAIGLYYMIGRKPAPLPTCGEGMKLDFSTRTCIPADAPDTSDELDYGDIEIKVPETSITVRLEKNDDQDAYSNVFADQKDPTIRGSVSLDYKKAKKLTDDLVMIPLSADYGGTGQFTYAVLINSKTKAHVGSAFVGDRIAISSVDYAGGIAKVNYKTRLESESFAVEPTIPAQLVLRVGTGSLEEVMRLQNADYSDVEIKSPAANSEISGDLVIRGSVPGSWYHEAISQFEIMDSGYSQIAFGPVQALSDWMTTQRVPFEIKVPASTISYSGKATVRIHSENVEGGEDGERKVRKLELPVVIK